ncbi:MAG: protein-L-isoaspartate(D-aspartate) O-methyltransferase [Candidatus Omnitrophica bacterium]|nr:protein-L-isoaspartate(D-aspartate) O-methyltransferase [Candidatus Omnitrophota bacterium]
MVTEQIASRGVKDPGVLEVMRRLPRHLFIPESRRAWAYVDSPVPIGEGQTISQPYIVALMTELLELDGSERVLEIGTGSGYQAAVLAELAGEVYTIELIPVLARTAEEVLRKLGYTAVNVRCGNGYAGWPEQAPFDAIIVTAAPPEVPPALVEQLAEGGRMVIPVGRQYQQLLLLIKENGRIRRREIIPVRFVPMVD